MIVAKLLLLHQVACALTWPSVQADAGANHQLYGSSAGEPNKVEHLFQFAANHDGRSKGERIWAGARMSIIDDPPDHKHADDDDHGDGDGDGDDDNDDDGGGGGGGGASRAPIEGGVSRLFMESGMGLKPRPQTRGRQAHLASVEQLHRGPSYVATSKDRFWHNNRLRHAPADWCSRDCEPAAGNSSHRHANRSICASDGRLYASLCELKRHSCRHNVRLRRRPRAFCPEENPLGQQAAMASSHHDRVRIVELKRLCDGDQYAQMKRLMFNEFNGDLKSMFSHYDVDADNYIEAHELWPTKTAPTNGDRLMYAQVWNNHTTKCPQNNNNNNNDHDHSKCWYFLDFAFEPQYAKNPCSLSHLMLFDLKSPHHRFDYESFAGAFANFTTNGTSVQDGGARSARKLTRIVVGLGDNIDLRCRATTDEDPDWSSSDNGLAAASSRCTWTRYNSNLAAARDPHISIRELQVGATRELLLQIVEAQLYLSGHFKCVCHFQDLALNLEHTYHLQVLAEPRVKVSPHYQWSLPKSRVSFECQYDQIDTSLPQDTGEARNKSSTVADAKSTGGPAELQSQFGLSVEWRRADQVLNLKQPQPKPQASGVQQRTPSDPLVDQLAGFASPAITSDPFEDGEGLSGETPDDNQVGLCNTSARASISTANSRLTLENLQSCDSGQYTCRVELPQRSGLNASLGPLVGQQSGYLRVQEKPEGASFAQQQRSAGSGDDQDQDQDQEAGQVSSLWVMHENGISVYRIQDDDGQEMELLREINGHSPIGAQVEGNWNQLTLCGGLNTEQAVICQWSDNALSVRVERGRGGANHHRRPAARYVYVGQPNLNRVVVLDGLEFEVVSVINTEPQPRRLHLYEPNRIHLSKWLKRRLSPMGNARWEAAIGSRAHPPEWTPHEEPRLHSAPWNIVGGSANTIASQTATTADSNAHVNETTIGGQRRPTRATSDSSVRPSLVQHDIWLLCYGQPLVPPDPSGSVSGSGSGGRHRRRQRSPGQPFGGQQSADSSSSPSSEGPRLSESSSASRPVEPIKPFEPRLSTGGVAFSPFAWPPSVWLPPNEGSSTATTTNTNDNNNNDNGNPNVNKEATLRNRKSVHIIQSTFLPAASRDGSVHRHEESFGGRQENLTGAVAEFKQTSVVSTHHLYPARTNYLRAGARGRASLLAPGRYDLIQDLLVPQRPHSVEKRAHFKIHHAYVTHYDERRLFRVSMDNYRYDREIDLQDCDPVHMLAAAQGLLVIQCRAAFSHSLIGQLVLDQLTAARIEFNANIRAQESYLSPDNRYLVSIFHNTSPSPSPSSSSVPETPMAAAQTTNNTGQGAGESSQTGKQSASSPISGDDGDDADSDDNSDTVGQKSQQAPESSGSQTTGQQQRHSSIVYVQTVTLDGLRLQYEIKTLFEISQCSFVWKDGYYAAIFVTTNRKDKQSEILSLRLIDSRLELMARVPGLVSGARHKEQLVVAPELRLAALTTSQGTYVIDLVENRVSQSLRRHLWPPTLLWV